MDQSINEMRQDLARAGYSPSAQAHYRKVVERLGARFGKAVRDVTRVSVRRTVPGSQGSRRAAAVAGAPVDVDGAQRSLGSRAAFHSAGSKAWRSACVSESRARRGSTPARYSIGLISRRLQVARTEYAMAARSPAS